jgi:hypothetical protein
VESTDKSKVIQLKIERGNSTEVDANLILIDNSIKLSIMERAKPSYVTWTGCDHTSELYRWCSISISGWDEAISEATVGEGSPLWEW